MSSSNELIGYDEQQSSMMLENCILVDEHDRALGPISKFEAHKGNGNLHRAFSVLLFNTDNQLLLQQRSQEKITFPGVWANSCCSHPLHITTELDEQHSAGVITAAIRKMEQELGIDKSTFTDVEFIPLGVMHYIARANEDWIEHEMDHIMAVRTDVITKPNLNEIENICWVDASELQQMCDSPDYTMAPWFLGIKHLFLDNWWPSGSLDDCPVTTDIQHMGVLV